MKPMLQSLSGYLQKPFRTHTHLRSRGAPHDSTRELVSTGHPRPQDVQRKSLVFAHRENWFPPARRLDTSIARASREPKMAAIRAGAFFSFHVMLAHCVRAHGQ